MDILTSIGGVFRRIVTRFREDSFDSLLGIVDTVPSLAGFSLRKDKIFVPFFIFHLSLLTYIYGVGSFEYQAKTAKSAGDFIKSFVNVALLVLIANNSHFFMMKRSLLRSTLTEMQNSDKLARCNPASRLKHKKLCNRIKYIILIFYFVNLTNASCVYLPSRSNVDVNIYGVTPCYGMGSLTSPKREICKAMLFGQEVTVMIVVLNFQALLIFVIGHTSLLYQILSDEIMALNDYDKSMFFNNPVVKDILPVLIRRHAMILSIINKCKVLYSVPIGVNFGSNAVCMSLFFYLPLREWIDFFPILMYCFIVFFLYCFLCQRLTNAAQLFETSVYACGWENFETNEKKAVYFMLRQAQKPVELLAADIIPVNISTFATTLQAMFKFVTVVKV
ncbi:hypothetical protein evm_008226 [Chilo suppressalis]|nr:hypothetical protein evm_008226 [Chilo suppressalis]